MATSPTSTLVTGAPPEAERHPAVGPVLLLVCGAMFLALLDFTVVNVAFPNLRQSFPTIPISRLSWVITAYAVFFAAVLAAAGKLADVLGRRRLFLVSVLGFTLTSVAAAAAPSAAWLIVARAAQGIAAAGMIPAALGLLLAYTPPEKRAAALGAWGAVGGMAAATGPSLGGLLADVWGWRAVFVINVPIGLLIALGGLRGLPADAPSDRRLPDPLGTVALVLAIGGPVTGLSQGTEWGWGSPAVLGCLACGVVFGCLVAVRTRRHPTPAIDPDLWRSRVFTAANVSSALFGAAMYAWLLACPLFLATIWRYSVLKAGLGVTPGAFTAALGSVLVGRRVPVRRQWLAVLAGALLVAGSLVFIGLVLDTDPAYVRLWLAPGLLAGLGVGCVLTGLSTIGSVALPPERFAAGTGMLMTSRQVGGAVGVAGLAMILEDNGALNPDAYLTGFLWSGVVGVLAALSAVALRSRA